ncbi:MAG: hypothetical protein RBG1_1C00001G1692 [candidate division Zixibacteria bacterium RBG-1]|nr:MAG: hypothetical protein RBG1_1C00001G1692 [candidate division Zixibacteria bacterium RBG-1]
MKKLLILLAGAILLLPAFAFAGNPSPWPPIGTEVEVFQLEGDAWRSLGIGDPGAFARAFTSLPAVGDSNRQFWRIDFQNHASVAQWVRWSITGTRWDWFVRKPGCYAADCIGFTIASNYDVDILYAGFDDLLYQGTGGVTLTIPVWYATWNLGTPPPPASDEWIPAALMNGKDILIPDSEQLHQGLSAKLWNKICVQQSNSACEYEDDAVVVIELKRIKPWIDPETGYFRPLQ